MKACQPAKSEQVKAVRDRGQGPWWLVLGIAASLSMLVAAGCGGVVTTPRPTAAPDPQPSFPSSTTPDPAPDGRAQPSEVPAPGADSAEPSPPEQPQQPAEPAVDASTLHHKLLMGYQGWFSCPDDGSRTNRWHHWLDPGGPTFKIDMWPDLSELDPDELFTPPGVTLEGGQPAQLFSAHREKTVVRHFLWMKAAGLDGVLLQRFLGEIQDPVFREFRDQVARNVRSGAERHGRVFALEYDLSMGDCSLVVQKFQEDWRALVDGLRLTESARYLRHRGKPVLAIWGLGFTDRCISAAQSAEILDWLQRGAEPRYQATVIGGVPTGWRTLSGDSKTEPAWAAVYRSLDVLSPWSVGRYGDDAGADAFAAQRLGPDLAELAPLGIDYLPVTFPGFSWHNLTGGRVNEIPRRGGAFYWRQIHNAIAAGAAMIKTAMFDEVDEGTAMFKVAPTRASVPTQSEFLTLDADGLLLKSDHYLRLAGSASRMLRGEIPLSPRMPTP